MGTNTHVLALPCSPDRTREPTASAVVANFGIVRPPRARYDHADPPAVLGRILFGYDEDRDTPWVTFDPREVSGVRRDVTRALQKADAAASHDEIAEWFASQLRLVDGVLAHAERYDEWVVAVFEGDDACFRRGGIPHHEPGDFIFSPHCALPPERSSRMVPLGIAGVLVTGLAIAGWRHRRFLSKRRSE